MTTGNLVKWGLLLAVKVGISAASIWTYASQRGMEEELIDGVRVFPSVAAALVREGVAVATPGGVG